MPRLSAVEVSTADTPDAAIIWLHGLGADGHDFEPLVPELHLPESLGVRFIFPHAPTMPVTINNGYVMPAWYDILEMNLDRRVDTAQLRDSAVAVGEYVDREIERGIDSRRIIVAGFSQGGAVAIELALCHPAPLAGLVLLSTYFPTSDSIVPGEANRALPVFIGHGSADPIVPESLGRAAETRLRALGHDCDWHSYPMEHSVCLEEIRDISAWLQARLAGPG